MSPIAPLRRTSLRHAPASAIRPGGGGTAAEHCPRGAQTAVSQSLPFALSRDERRELLLRMPRLPGQETETRIRGARGRPRAADQAVALGFPHHPRAHSDQPREGVRELPRRFAYPLSAVLCADILHIRYEPTLLASPIHVWSACALRPCLDTLCICIIGSDVHNSPTRLLQHPRVVHQTPCSVSPRLSVVHKNVYSDDLVKCCIHSLYIRIQSQRTLAVG
ncbi:hypothetical protein BD413DRAFT_156449 [Trametes elegans]|nr:hypothetical protein BD413DRAFT_156449 [Trametes elegans]